MAAAMAAISAEAEQVKQEWSAVGDRTTAEVLPEQTLPNTEREPVRLTAPSLLQRLIVGLRVWITEAL
jgi:hypothetical protein